MFRLFLRLAALAPLYCLGALLAQPPAPILSPYAVPQLTGITPPGMKIGTSLEIELVGSDLEAVTALHFTHPGIKAVIVPPPPPPAPDPKTKAPPPPKPPTPPKFKISVAADVPPGQYDLRAVSPAGVSNPRYFTVSEFNEVVEKEPNNDVPEAMKLELPVTVNGSFASGTDIDYYQFAGKKGQHLILNCLAASIDSRARPVMEIYAANGKLLSATRMVQRSDLVASLVVPEDGDYFVRLAEFTYLGGGPLAVYRLTISSTPYIDAVEPAAVEFGKPTLVTLYGRNLPGGKPYAGPMPPNRPALETLQVTITPPADPLAAQRLSLHALVDPEQSGLDGFEYRLKGPGGTSNGVLIGLTNLPVVAEKADNDTPETAQEIAVPSEIAGKIEKRYDKDYYRINAKKGEAVWIELFGDRIGAASEFTLNVANAKTKAQIAEATDDNQEILNPVQFPTRHGDPTAYKFVPPEDGMYLIRVNSRESGTQYGPRVRYRLKVQLQRPDFRLIVMPPSDNQPETALLRGDGYQSLDIFVWRQNGFNDSIALTAEGLPAGVTALPDQFVSEGQRYGSFVFAVADNAAPWLGTIAIKGTATIAGKPVVRKARSAVITHGVAAGQNLPVVARMSDGPMVSVANKAPFKVTLEPQNAFVKAGEKLAQPIFVNQGEKLTVPFKVVRHSADAKVPITLQQILASKNGQQEPVVVNNGQPLPPVAPDKAEGKFEIQIKPNAKPGPYMITLRATAPMQIDDMPQKKKKPLLIGLPTNPIRLTVLPLTVGKISIQGPQGNLKTGMENSITVKIERQFDYAGAYTIKVVFPPNTKGLTAADVTIPAGQTEAKVILKAAPDAPAGTVNNIILQATGIVETKPIVQEAKFNLNVEKTPPPKK